MTAESMTAQTCRLVSIKEVIVEMFEVGSPTPFAVYELGDALITSDSIGGSTTGVQENLT